MSPAIALLVLTAAVLHASWNALLKGGSDRLWSMAVMSASGAVLCAAGICVLPAPARASWGCIIASGLLHVGYNLFLVRAYRSGDFGATYPIARGTAPLLVTLGALLFAHEVPTPHGLAGIALISGGVISLAFRGRKLPEENVRYAIGTGLFIAAYSVTDGIGVRLSSHPVSYAAWMCLGWGLAMPLLYIGRRGAGRLWRGSRALAAAAAGGAVSLLAYGIVLYAMSRTSMGPVAALRETSVLFGAVIGGLAFREKLTPRRLLSCAVIAAGAALIG